MKRVITKRISNNWSLSIAGDLWNIVGNRFFGSGNYSANPLYNFRVFRFDCQWPMWIYNLEI